VSSVVVLRALGLGDLLTALPALRGVREAFSGRRVVLVAPRPLAPLARHAGCVDEVCQRAPLAAVAPLPEPPEVAVNLHGRGPRSHRLLLETRPGGLVAFAHPEVDESRSGPPWRDDEHEVDRWCRLLAAYRIAADPSRLDLAPPHRPVPDRARGATLIHPGAASPARCWPAQRWAAVARVEASRRGVVVTGNGREAPLARRVAGLAGLDPSCVVAGTTDVLDLAALVAAAGRVLCGDTGVAHLATALGTPSVVLFGPTSPARWGPPAGRARHRVLWAGWHGDPHADEPDRGLLAIGVEDVLAELAALDERSGALTGARS
jgi:ADP-heptose:LPS heptosyltransferase